jgi:hypothetical protein
MAKKLDDSALPNQPLFSSPQIFLYENFHFEWNGPSSLRMLLLLLSLPFIFI